MSKLVATLDEMNDDIVLISMPVTTNLLRVLEILAVALFDNE